MKKIIKENIIPITIWTIFEIIAITLFLSTKKIFYLLNFTYIGTCVGAGISLMIYKKKYARHFVQLGVGIYMLIYLGILSRENMQIEGFWYYLFLGVFEAATLLLKYVVHYFSVEVGVDTPAGRQWYLTYYHTKYQKKIEKN